jgi:hypothetical protein
MHLADHSVPRAAMPESFGDLRCTQPFRMHPLKAYNALVSPNELVKLAHNSPEGAGGHETPRFTVNYLQYLAKRWDARNGVFQSSKAPPLTSDHPTAQETTPTGTARLLNEGSKAKKTSQTVAR